MGTGQSFRIVGTGSYLPPRRITAAEVDRRMGAGSGWTLEHTGVESRYECEPPDDLISMGASAVGAAMKNADVGWSEVDYIIDCSTSKYRPIPNNASHLQAAIGAEAFGIPCIDLQSTCLGSIVGLNVANALFQAERCRHILLVTSERTLAAVNWEQRESAALLGDGAAAMVLRGEASRPTLLYRHETHAEHLALCRIDGGSQHLPPFDYTPARDGDYRFTMDGPAVFRVARRLLPPMVKAVLSELDADEIARLQVVPHQASPSAVEAVRRTLDLPSSRYHVGVHEFGNIAAAGIPMMFDQLNRAERLRRGDPVMVLGTSAGYSQAAMVFQW
ncbi:MAG: ketoacyl-ACP synthase III [Planctomycetota bacterium]